MSRERYRPALTPAQVRSIVARYRRGNVSLRDLARAYGCSTKPIADALRRRRVPRRPTNNPHGRPKGSARA